jgi:DNA ligase-1
VIQFARTCESIGETPSKTEKISRLAEYFRAIDDADLEASARFFTGSPFAQRDQKNLTLGGNTIVAAAKNVWGIGDSDISAAYREAGDLGSALCAFIRPPLDLGLFSQTLSPASLRVLFEDIANVSGKNAGARRLHLCQRILSACTRAIEAKYVIKIMTGDLRIGLREGFVVEAVAEAFAQSARDVRKASMLSGDIGSVAIAAKIDALDGICMVYGSPIGFMLASPLTFGGSYRELARGGWLVEDKFDGIRAQAHKNEDGVRLFSRTSNDISRSYPEIVDALKNMPGRFVVDGEIIAHRNGGALPFRYLQARMQRKIVTADLLDEVPVLYVCFDILACGDDFLLDEPLSHRRAMLAGVVHATPHVTVSQSRELMPVELDETLGRLFYEARSRGHEGLLLKRADSPYHPGRRGKWWFKLKRELSTLDVVVVAVEWGHGKRAKVLSDYTFAVRGMAGELLTIGKAYSGLTDAEITELTRRFLDHRIGRKGHGILVEPTIVLEVAFDIVQPSDLHQSGFALRFPRIVRIRDDKPASEIDTIGRVDEIYKEMLRREGVER